MHMRNLIMGFIGAGPALLLGWQSSASAATEAPGSLYDYFVMNVCVDKAGKITDQNPLQCPINQQRDLRPGEAVPYFHADYPPVSDTHACDSRGTNRRYAFPLGIEGSDQTGAHYPLIAGWDDYPPSAASDCQWGTLDRRDSVSILAIIGGYGAILGDRTHGEYYVSLGSGYADPSVKGAARFSKSWAFPEMLPPLNAIGGGSFYKKTHLVGHSSADALTLPASDPAVQPAKTLEWWKHLMFAYGAAGHQTKPLDTLVQFGYVRSNSLGDAPEESKGSEHIYLTRELGWVTRWEDWHRDDAKDVIAKARKAYDNQNCGLPADLAGDISPHLQFGPMIDDTAQHLYRQDVTVKDVKAGVITTHVWYMVGCHDYTNIHAQPRFVPTASINAETLGTEFLGLFKAQ
jgi:hypothetical protein